MNAVDANLRHVAIIMDGNGRWATARGLARTEGHTKGEAALFDTVEGALEMELPWLTVYAFSTENWKRPPAEVRFIMWFNRDLLTRRAQELHDRGVRVRFVGRREAPIPDGLLKIMAETESLTAANTKLTLQIAFNYGGQAEIVDAAKQLCARVARGELEPNDIDEAALTQEFYAPDAPAVDLLIRTSGERRISNFLIWQAAYAELYFDDVQWPAYRRDDLFRAAADFHQRQRRFGAV